MSVVIKPRIIIENPVAYEIQFKKESPIKYEILRAEGLTEERLNPSELKAYLFVVNTENSTRDLMLYDTFENCMQKSYQHYKENYYEGE